MANISSAWLGAVKVTDEEPKHIRIQDFSGGLNNKLPANSIADNEISDGLNMYFKYGKALSTRFGCIKYNAEVIPNSSGITGLFAYYTVAGDRHLIATSGSHIYRSIGAVPTSMTDSFSPALTNNKDFMGLGFGDYFYMVNGTDNMVKIDGSTASYAAGSPPVATMIAEHKNILFLGGVVGRPNIIYYSSIEDGESWPTENAFPIESDSPVSALWGLGNSLFIFTKDSAFALEGASSESFFKRKLTNDYGCVGKRAVTEIGQYLAFIDPKGPRAIIVDEGYKFVDISSDKVPELFAGINEAHLDKITATAYKDLLIFNVPYGSSTVNNARLVYDMTRQAWCPLWTEGYSCETIYDTGTSLIYYSGDPTTGQIYTNDYGLTDDGTGYENYLVTKDFNNGLPFNPKRFRKIWGRYGFTGNQTDRRVNCTTYIDGNLTDTTAFDFGEGTSPIIYGGGGVREAIADTYIESSNPDTNYSDATTIKAKMEETNLDYALLRFDLSDIPAGSVIRRADLLLSTATNTGKGQIAIYRLVDNWVNDEATWNVPSAGGAWTGTGGGYDEVGVNVFDLQPETYYNVVPLEVMAQDAVTNKAGILDMVIRIEAEFAGEDYGAEFASLEHPTLPPPRLVVEYTDGVHELTLPFILGGDTEVVRKRARTSGRGASIKYKLSNPTSNQQFTVYSLEWTEVIKPAK